MEGNEVKRVRRKKVRELRDLTVKTVTVPL